MVIDIGEVLINESMRRIAEKVGQDYDAGIFWLENIDSSFSDEDTRNLAIRLVAAAKIVRMTRLN